MATPTAFCRMEVVPAEADVNDVLRYAEAVLISDAAEHGLTVHDLVDVCCHEWGGSPVPGLTIGDCRWLKSTWHVKQSAVNRDGSMSERPLEVLARWLYQAESPHMAARSGWDAETDEFRASYRAAARRMASEYQAALLAESRGI